MIQKTGHGDMKLTLEVWRQAAPGAPGKFETYEVDANEHMSFLEMLDVLNQELVERGEEPVVFEHDCREGICGSCNLTIDGKPHGPRERTTVCQLHMREYRSGDRIKIEPWRANAFPIVKDLMVDRSAFDRIQRLAATSRSTPGRSGCARDPGREAERRYGLRCGRLHRLRRLRRRLPERVRDALHVGEGEPVRPAPPGPARA